MVRTVIGGLLGGLGMYLVGFLFWGTPLSGLAFNRAGDQAGANLQNAMAQALTASGTGVYVIPDPATAQGTVLYGKGPVATVFYSTTGFPVTDSGAMIGGLILALVTGVLIALALRYAVSDFGSRARTVILFAVAAVLWLHIGQSVLNHAPWGYMLYLAFSDFLALTAAGLIAAKVMQPSAPGSTSPSSLH